MCKPGLSPTKLPPPALSSCQLSSIQILTMPTSSLLSRYLPEGWILDLSWPGGMLPVLRTTVSIVGIVLGVIILINVRSFPLLWHIKVLLPFGIMLCKYRILSIQHVLLLRPASTRHKAVIAKLEAVCPVGAHPFDFTATCTSWASPDDTDWFGHLNNSSYAKARDAALSKFALAACPTFVNAGGRVVLASTHYQFLREIPRWARYEMKLTIGAWDQKWLYLLCRFTSRPKSSHKTFTSPESKEPTLISGRLTPIGTSDSESNEGNSDGNRRTILASLHRDHPDKILNCFTVSRVCFKIGRITVPPAIVMACEGFSKPPQSGSYSHECPPPHWVHPHGLRNASESLEEYRAFLAGRWRDVPEGGRWWIEPLSGQIEERRRANLVKLEAVHNGVAGCMDIW